MSSQLCPLPAEKTESCVLRACSSALPCLAPPGRRSAACPGLRSLTGMAEGRFYLSVLALSSLGSMCVLFTVYWMWSWHGGFAWDGSILTFNCHPVLMVAGLVVVYSAASLVYRLPQSWVGPKLPWKIAHASLHLLAFILTVLGLVAVFRYHNHQHIANLYSLHSWLGITTVFFFACQEKQITARTRWCWGNSWWEV
ncbi:PREDICTED: cytochrome b ascorbate-dependent protein 3 isoform X3 [Myotis brandtii]|uniref:cytochrome b ascorbate-dependent protein 3 isoform X3 n=1 Tax=Myotis brandtii TaxID=109478 RepID=UPI000703E556|nr:PREDICTED: cytochrome b ascorbate-dependent protein 3 isoform X3 [Myotis brandtii]XP_014400045.1 PREDICTED: cytochrome b ascorbate-dependent protein 3 isoform X3 [Myotis brandtii]